MKEIKNFHDVEYITAHQSNVYSPDGTVLRYYDFARRRIIDVEEMFFKGFTYNNPDYTEKKE